VISDNAKTFLSAKYKLTEVYGHLSPKWKFIVPRSPWWGGFYERLVRSVKSSLKKSIGKCSLARAELETDLFEIEACVNSRPLTFVGDTLESGNPLTPSHFLLGRSSSFLPGSSDMSDIDLEITTSDLTDRQILRKLHLQQFWKIWSEQYLRSLPHMRSRFCHKCDLSVGSIVLIREDNLKRQQWPLALVTELHPGRCILKNS
jgi:hypothetical protein